MKTLSTIQKLAKFGRILSKIIFICSIVGSALCLVGLISLALGLGELSLGDVTVKGLVEDKLGRSMGVLYATVICGLLAGAAEAVLSYLAVRYFTRELADGTPFRMESSRELFRLGFLRLCVLLGTHIVSALICGIIQAIVHEDVSQGMTSFGSASIGVMFMVLALVCRHGAEVSGEQDMSEG